MKIQFLFEVKFSSFTLVTQYFRILFYSVIFQILLQTLKLKFFYTECFCSSNLKIELYKDLKILNYWKTLMKKKNTFYAFPLFVNFFFCFKNPLWYIHLKSQSYLCFYLSTDSSFYNALGIFSFDYFLPFYSANIFSLCL